MPGSMIEVLSRGGRGSKNVDAGAASFNEQAGSVAARDAQVANLPMGPVDNKAPRMVPGW